MKLIGAWFASQHSFHADLLIVTKIGALPYFEEIFAADQRQFPSASPSLLENGTG